MYSALKFPVISLVCAKAQSASFLFSLARVTNIFSQTITRRAMPANPKTIASHLNECAATIADQEAMGGTVITRHQRRVVSTTMRRARNLLEKHEGSANKALFAACESGDSDVVVCLVREFGADVCARDERRCTPLHCAASTGDHEVVRLLVKDLGADVKTKDSELRTPLHFAACRGRLEVMRMLVNELGADVNAWNRNAWTSLHLAASNGHIEATRVLVNELGLPSTPPRFRDTLR